MDPTDVPPGPTLEQLKYVVNNYPIIDNHARSLILPTLNDTIPFETITSEAQGRALRDAPKSLAHLRASRQLRYLYECSDDADWEDVLEQRTEWLKSNPERLNQRCFEGVHAQLVDDGASGPGLLPYNFIDRYTKAPSKRIVCIEILAENLMRMILQKVPEAALSHVSFFTDTWVTFTEEFEREILDAVHDPSVAGFKSIICYRTGLDIEPEYQQAAQEVGHPFERYLERSVRKKEFRIERKPLNDYLVLRTLEVLSEQLPHPEALSKPLQLHTGFGDNDINLLQSNPAYLQPLIEGYPKVPFVLLHSSYPYTREASYLATVYKQVYVDLGGVFPMLSRDGQKTVLRECFEFVPGSKLLYSSSGKSFPEAFWLANRQFREALLELFTEYIEKDDITPHQAIAMTKDLFFNNSNILYNLRHEAVFNEIPLARGHIAYNVRPESETAAPIPSVSPLAGSAARDNTAPSRTPEGGYEPPPFPPPPKEPQVYDVQMFDDFLAHNKGIKFINVQWVDYTSSLRARLVPIKEFDRAIRSGTRIGIPRAKLGMLQPELEHDETTPISDYVYVEPDLRTLRRAHSKDPLPSATVLCFWRDKTGRPVGDCPRANLEHLVTSLKYNYDVTLLCGFDIGVTFLAQESREFQHTYDYDRETIDTPDQWTQLPFLVDIVSSLSDMDIDLQQFEAQSYQYRFVFSPQSPLAAIDSLMQARQAITQIAARHGRRATLHPRPFPDVQSSTQTLISMEPPNKETQFFVGGVSKHLPAICAFTMAEAESYGTADPDLSVARDSALGDTKFRAPLRRMMPGYWQLSCLDGFANMYFALTAIIAAGSLGLAASGPRIEEHGDQYDPEQSTAAEYEAAQEIIEYMPRTVEEAGEALSADAELKHALSDEFVEMYLLKKKKDRAMLEKMDGGKRRQCLIGKY